MNKLSANRELRFALIFLLTFAALQFGYSALRGTAVEHLVIDIATVTPGTALINLVGSGAQAIARGPRILSPNGSITVLNGCEGTETLFLLSAAIIAFRTRWKNRLKGILLGAALIYSLNLVRIVVLFFAAQNHPGQNGPALRTWFDAIHGFIAPSLIIVLTALFFLWWAHWPTHPAQHAAPEQAA